jgi:hypothetical protein
MVTRVSDPTYADDFWGSPRREAYGKGGSMVRNLYWNL